MGLAHQLKWDNYSQHILSTLERLQVNDELTDVTLISEGKRIKAHKVLLSACSKFFNETFKDNPDKHPVVVLKGVTFSDAQAAIQYIYTGHVNVTEERLPSFLETADILEIKGSHTQIKSVTDAYVCAQCSANRSENKINIDVGSQTEECTAVQFGLQDDIPRIFYTTLLSDNNLQHKIAQTINEHIDDPKGEKHGGDVVQKISSQAETEIDKFLGELLKDLPDDSNNSMPNDIGLSLGGGTASFTDSNLSSVFKDADMNMLFGESSNTNVPYSAGMGEGGPEKTIVSTTNNQSSLNNVQTLTTPPPPNVVLSGIAAMDVDLSNSNPAKTPNPSHGQCSVKRITPTPVSSNAPPAVFNSSVIIEKKKIDFGDHKSAKCTVKTANIEPPEWQKLHRKSITPKIPQPKSQTVSSNTRVILRSSETLLTLGPGLSDTKASEKQFVAEESGPGVAKASTSTISPPVPPVITRLKDQSNPASASKRKATPVKLTPEKARNAAYNFMHVNVSSDMHPKGSLNKPGEPDSSVNSNTDSGVKKTPSISSSQSQHTLVLANENSQSDNTPLQQLLPTTYALESSASSLQTISPNALQRLIFSANKIGYNTAPAATFLNKKKSFSTPRKRKHVRSLTFATPPSLKSATPDFEQPEGVEAKTSQKRKATDDALSAEIRSKKRLNWPESEKKRATKTQSAEELSSRQTNDELRNVVTNVPTTVHIPSDTARVQQPPPAQSTMEEPVTIEAQPKSMPTILEESMSDIPDQVLERKKEEKPPKKAQVTVVVQEPTDDVAIQQAEDLQPESFEEIVSPPPPTEDNATKRPDDSTHDQMPLPVVPPHPVTTDQPPITERQTRSMPTIQSMPDISVGPHDRRRRKSKKEKKSSKKPKVTLSGKGLSIQPKDDSVRQNLDDSVQEVVLPVITTTDQTTVANPQMHLPAPPLINDKQQSNVMQSKSLPTILEGSSSGIMEETSRRSNKKDKKSSRKSKPTVTEIALFGESPVKPKRTSKKEKEVKRPVDVVAAQAVAHEAVPLGNPRRSPRIRSVKPKPKPISLRTLKKPQREHDLTPPNENAVPFPSENTENQASSGPVAPEGSTTSQSQLETIPFNIVPAPLGFPEPTPMKSFAELGYLNVSNTGFNSPLITPLKSGPPLGPSDNFTLPPTPRLIEDHDSNSNSTHSLRLYEGLYPINLLSSTPMKFGIPKTPGKESNSSNSRSPPDLGKPGLQVIQKNMPPLLPISQDIPQKIVDVPESVSSPSPIHEHEPLKSDGELSSSDDNEGEESPSSSITLTYDCNQPPPQPDTEASCPPPPPSYPPPLPSSQPPPPSCPPPPPEAEPAYPVPTSAISKPQVLVSSSNLPRNRHPPCPPNSQPKIALSVDPCLKQFPEIEFQVGGRGTKLTISEKETLLTLLEIGSQPPALNIKNQDLPKPTAPVAPEVSLIPDKPKPTDNDEQKQPEPHTLLRNRSLTHLINLVRRKTQQGSPATPPDKK